MPPWCHSPEKRYGVSLSAPPIPTALRKLVREQFEDSRNILENSRNLKREWGQYLSREFFNCNSRKLSNFEARVRVTFSRVLTALVQFLGMSLDFGRGNSFQRWDFGLYWKWQPGTQQVGCSFVSSPVGTPPEAVQFGPKIGKNELWLIKHHT